MLCALVLAGCNKDNYEAPKSCLTGRIVYEDEAVGLRQTGTGQDYNVLELYQPGFEGTGNIPVYVDQEGNFTVLFTMVLISWLLRRGTVPGRIPEQN